MDEMKKLATYAKNMICPNLWSNDISEQGQKDFSVYKYRENSSHYKGDSLPDTKIFMEKLTGSLEKLPSNKTPLLLLSDGKDSLGLALAYSKLGIKCQTLTLLRKNDSELKNYILSTTKKLGHEAHFVDIEEIIHEFDTEVFLNSCKYMDNPVLDQGYIFFLFALSKFFNTNHLESSDFIVVDGLGNDETLGYLPSRNQLISYKLSSLNLWKFIPNSLSFIRWYIRSPSESHGDLSALSCFFNISNAYDLNKYFKYIHKTESDVEYISFRAFSRGSFHDHQCMMGKTRTSAKYLGVEYCFPWIDQELADFCFNLPQKEKYDFKSKTNKLLLRKLLKENIEWEQNKRGIDLFFDLDINYFSEKIVLKVVPKNLVDTILKKNSVPRDVKQRALLELLNFYGFCLSKGYKANEIEEVLK